MVVVARSSITVVVVMVVVSVWCLLVLGTSWTGVSPGPGSAETIKVPNINHFP